MDKIEKIPIPEDIKRVLDNVSHILIGLNYRETARDYKQAVEKLISLLEVEEPDKSLEEAAKGSFVVGNYVVHDGRIELGGDPLPSLDPILLLPYPQFKPGDKVRIVVLKEEE